MTIGNELDQAFYNLGQRITRLEKKDNNSPTTQPNALLSSSTTRSASESMTSPRAYRGRTQ